MSRDRANKFLRQRKFVCEKGYVNLISFLTFIPKVPSSTLIEAVSHSTSERIRSGLHYLASMSQVTLYDVKTVLPGHGAPLSDVAPGFILDRIAAVRRKAEQMLLFLQAQPATLWEISKSLFPQAKPDSLIFVLSNVAGYLDLLAANGQIAERNDGALVRYVAMGASTEIAV